MEKRYDHILQFKISLKGVSPPIWRRLQVPCTYTFWDLHVALQDAMGWLDYHLHMFDLRDPITRKRVMIGIPDDDGFEDDIAFLPGWTLLVVNFLTLANRTATYTYDFGDDWRHTVRLERIESRDKKRKYPVCLAGRRACPPEDCGGIFGYFEFLEAIKNPNHEEHQNMLKWVDGHFDPEYFDRTSVLFDDPHERWKKAFIGE